MKSVMVYFILVIILTLFQILVESTPTPTTMLMADIGPIGSHNVYEFAMKGNQSA